MTNYIGRAEESEDADLTTVNDIVLNGIKQARDLDSVLWN